MVDLGGYVIVLVEKDGKIKLFGSAAERSDCDEILEINGSSVENMKHEQIVQHIHQCIKTRTICLRVKRRSSGKLGSSIDSSLIDAFVIGSRAREHLQTLTKDANITPKDIAQLSKILSEKNDDTDLKTAKEIDLENKENQMKIQSEPSRPSKNYNNLTEQSRENEKLNMRKSDSGDLDYLELNDDNMQLLKINPDPNIKLQRTDSQQSIVDLVKRSATISLSNTSLNKITYKRQDEEAKQYIPFKRLNSVVNRLEESIDDTNLKKLIEKTNFKTLIDIYSTLMQERYMNASIIELDSVRLHQEVVQLLQNKGNVDDDFIDLLEILTKFEYDGLFEVLDHMVERRKALSKIQSNNQDDISIQEEDNPESILEEEEEEEILKDNKIEEIESLKDEKLLIDDDYDRRNESECFIEEIKDEKEISIQQSEDDNLPDSYEFESHMEIKKMNESLDKDSIEDLPPTVPPLPLELINSFNLDLKTNTSSFITTTAEIPSLSSLASIIHSSIPSTQQMDQSSNQSFIEHQSIEPEIDFVPSSQSQNILQNTFLSTVNDSLNFANPVNLNQPPYCNLQQSNLICNNLSSNLIQPIPSITQSSIISSTIAQGTINQLDKQSIQPNLCNSEYSIISTNLLLNKTIADTPIVAASSSGTVIQAKSSFELPMNNVQLNEPISITNQNILNLQQQIEQKSREQNTSISALEYAAGQLPPAPLPPITNFPPDLNNLPANTKLSIVKIEKHSSEPLGATVRNEHDGRVTIGRIVCGGAASKCQALQEGDEILCVNNVYIRGKTVDQVCELLSAMKGTLTFIIAKRDLTQSNSINEKTKLNIQTPNIIRKSSTSSHDSANLPNGCKVIHYKAFFDYNPNTDIYIPCRELGLSFRRGDLLHIIDSSDECWWQSYKEGDINQNLAGLIPSLKFQQMREAAKKAEQENAKKQDEKIEVDSTDSSILNRKTTSSILSFNCGKRSNSKKRKSRKEFPICLDYYVPYEEMKQSMGHKRTVGPNNIGRQNLRERLVKHKSLFGTAIPHTTRNKRSDEKHGEDYYFVTNQQFKQYIEEDKFVEYGDYDRNYYGTSFSAIEDVLKSNRICIQNLHVESILKLRTPNAGKKFKPFFVFIAPPTNVEMLRKLVESINNMPISTNELHCILNEAYEIQRHFSHFFDLILTVTDIEETYKFLFNEISSLDKEAQWIQANWL